MSKFSFSRSGEASDGKRIQNRGDIAVRVTKLDSSTNSVTGINMSSPELEEVTISFATVGEYADFYSNRNRFTNADARQQEASRQLAKQPTVKSLSRNAVEINDVVQFQSVKELADGKLIARWANAVTTNAQAADAFARMEIMISIPKDKQSTEAKYERRVARAFNMADTAPASREALDDMTDAKVRNSDGRVLEGSMRNAVLISITDGTDVKATGVDMPWGNGGPATGSDALFARPMDSFNYQPVAALAAKVGVPFERLSFVEAGSTNAPQDMKFAQETAREIYEASQRGDVGVAITPGYVGDLMLHIKQNIIAREQQAANNTRTVSLSERGFFTADIGLMSGVETNDPKTGEVRPAQTAFKQILPAEFMHPTSDDKFIRRKASDLGDDAIQRMMENDMDRAAIFAPGEGYTPDQSAPKPVEPEQHRSDEFDNSPSY